MGLINVVRFVREDFVQSNCPAKVYYGKQFAEQNLGPNTVVFWPTSDSFGAADQSLLQPHEYRARALLTRNVGFDCEIWAQAPKPADAAQVYDADDGTLQALVNQVVLSLERCAQGISILGGGVQNQEVQTLKRGLIYILKGTVAVPVLDIQFPDGAIGPDVETWTLESGVSHEDTVSLIDPDS